MSITSGYTKYKRYAKLSDGTYKLVSQWTNANTVHFDDGSTAQTNLGAIKGITSDLAGESQNVAASIYAANQLNSKINELNSSLSSNYVKVYTGNFSSINDLVGKGIWTGVYAGSEMPNETWDYEILSVSLTENSGTQIAQLYRGYVEKHTYIRHYLNGWSEFQEL